MGCTQLFNPLRYIMHRSYMKAVIHLNITHSTCRNLIKTNIRMLMLSVDICVGSVSYFLYIHLHSLHFQIFICYFRWLKDLDDMDNELFGVPSRNSKPAVNKQPPARSPLSSDGLADDKLAESKNHIILCCTFSHNNTYVVSLTPNFFHLITILLSLIT